MTITAKVSAENTDNNPYWQAYFERTQQILKHADPILQMGKVTRVTGLLIEVSGLRLPIGSACKINLAYGKNLEAEVVGFEKKHLLLMPQQDVYGVLPGSTVVPLSLDETHWQPEFARRSTDRLRCLPVGFELLGRVIDASGRPLDGKGNTQTTQFAPLHVRNINPLQRARITQHLDVGVRAINALLTVGRGQRLGLFAGSGVGKSVLLGMMARYTEADVIVVGLIGERGREVKEFIEEILGEQGLSRAVVVAAPADVSPLLRLQGAAYATTIAEFFRDQGKNVLLIMDSLTRYAMAQREIALAAGEPPATKGYPPSVFTRLPLLVERAGNGLEGSGSITAFYTVLVEGDDAQDPIADAARAILDGHIVLERRLAESGHYPAINIEQSISRLMYQITDVGQQQAARQLKQLLASYEHHRDLIQVGAYVSGSDPLVDQAIAMKNRINAFLQQDIAECARWELSLQELQALFA